jgi:hypothetical protein
MTAVLDAITRMFVAPRADAVRVVSVTAAPSAAVCGPAAEPLACALALLLRRRGPAVVCAWGSAARRPQAPAAVGARRLAASMDARGLAARATGRLVAVALDPEPVAAAAEAGRAAAAAGDAPVVVALCGPRNEAFDHLLAGQDIAIVAAGDATDELVRLGVESLEAVVGRSLPAPALGGIGAWRARAGLAAGPATRRALAPALEALGGRR